MALWPELQVAEPDLAESMEFRVDLGDPGEELARLVDAQVEHLGDVFAFERDLERVLIVASAAAGLAGDVDIAEEVHVDLDEAVALASLATATGDVEAEAARACSPGPWRSAAGRTCRGSG